MSPPESNKSRGIVAEAPKADLVTTLLAISLVAVIIAIVCLLMELGRYGGDIKAENAQLRSSVDLPATAVPTYSRTLA